MFNSLLRYFKLNYRYILSNYKLFRSFIKILVSNFKKNKKINQLKEEANNSYQLGNWIKSQEIRSEKRVLKYSDFIEGGFDALNIKFIGSEISGSIGHMAISFAARAKEKLLYPKNKYKYIVLGQISANNKYLDLWKNYFEILMITKEERTIIETIFSPILESISEVNVNGSELELYRAHNILTNLYEENFPNKPLLQLGQTDVNLGLNFLKGLHLSKNQEFVTLHIRSDNSSGRGYGRNSNPQTYVEAIQYLTSKNIAVIRIGLPSKIKLPKIENFIDLTEVKSYKNKFDIFLLAKCKFMIGTTSGPLIVPHTFNVPVVATNAPDLARFVYLPNSLVVPKKIIDKNERLLSFEEMFSHGYGHLDGYIPEDRLKMHSWLDNSSTEILDAVIEMNNRFNFITTEEQLNISKKISSFGFDGNVKISNKFIEKNLSLFKNFGI